MIFSFVPRRHRLQPSKWIQWRHDDEFLIGFFFSLQWFRIISSQKVSSIFEFLIPWGPLSYRVLGFWSVGGGVWALSQSTFVLPLFPPFSSPDPPLFSRSSFPTIAHWFPMNSFSDWQKNPGEKWWGTIFLGSFPRKINTLSPGPQLGQYWSLRCETKKSCSDTHGFSRL